MSTKSTMQGFGAGCTAISGSDGARIGKGVLWPKAAGLIALALLWFCFAQNVQAQMIFDTIDLKVVEIQSRRYDQSAGYKTLSLDSAALGAHAAGSLAELLTASTPIFVKSYGQGSLATTSIRGASAAHTQVIWNGININSPMPGQADFSAVPVLFIDRADIYFGAGSARFSSGGLGGSILLTTVPDWQNQLRVNVQQQVGSFSTWHSNALVEAGSQRLQLSTRILHSRSKNDYPYLNIGASRLHPPIEHRYNAGWQQTGLLQQAFYRPSDNTILSLRLWVQDNDRNLPPNILVQVPENNESYREQNLRTVAAIVQYFGKSKITLQSGFMHSLSTYKNVISFINTQNRISSSLNEASYAYQSAENLLFTVTGKFDYHQVNSENYAQLQQRRQGSLTASGFYSPWPQLQLNLLVRQEALDGNRAPLSPAGGFNYQPFVGFPLKIKGNMAMNFHAPSLNDLYWSPGGNPDLKNETGYTAEAALAWDEKYGAVSLEAEAGWFYSDIDQWIVWQPDTVFSYWTPRNLKNVVAKGIEARLALKAKMPNFSWALSLNYSFTSATNRRPLSLNDRSANQQVIYVPDHLLNATASLAWKGFTLNYFANYTGRRYTTSDNSRYLPPFFINDVQLNKSIPLGKSEFELGVAVNNIGAANYQLIAWQPMPLRNYSFFIKYKFTK
ncbi:MAG: TonB-dependent receptor [Bacteroidales bacterium]|nr:TonB-dependent receptor [Bacteroidales bacterium]MDD4741060.1 TonB-dependent receptor [Bacteroidales bacterium]MDY0333526.1 TonB-dependent receptor [Bacteroidales bacterium]